MICGGKPRWLEAWHVFNLKRNLKREISELASKTMVILVGSIPTKPLHAHGSGYAGLGDANKKANGFPFALCAIQS
jgi:hypothetical protein